MSERLSTGTNEDDRVVAELVADAARLLLPLARMYLGPAGAGIEGDDRLLMLSLNKLVIEAGTLPAPGTGYAPHGTAFVIDPLTGRGNAIDLPFVLAGLRGLSAWASAAPMRNMTTTASLEASAAPRATARMPAMATSARELRSEARARSYGDVARAPRRSTGGGCGCRGATPPPASGHVRPSRRQPECRDPKPRCDCRGSCGGRGCGCSGTESCVDAIPRATPPKDRCSCGGCPPRAPEDCTPWTPSCETRNRLRACLKDILCELLLCIENAMCVDGRIDPAWRTKLRDCLVGLFCRMLRCIREALCPPPVDCTPPQLPVPNDCLPCSYAVEESR